MLNSPKLFESNYFPSGLYLEAFIQEELGNTSITLLSGSVVVEFVEQKKNVSLQIGEKIQVR